MLPVHPNDCATVCGLGKPTPAKMGAREETIFHAANRAVPFDPLVPASVANALDDANGSPRLSRSLCSSRCAFRE